MILNYIFVHSITENNNIFWRRLKCIHQIWTPTSNWTVLMLPVLMRFKGFYHWHVGITVNMVEIQNIDASSFRIWVSLLPLHLFQDLLLDLRVVGVNSFFCGHLHSHHGPFSLFYWRRKFYKHNSKNRISGKSCKLCCVRVYLGN